MNHIGIFGGTFDPVHFGHLRSALELGESLQLDEVRMIPCHRPAHRTTPGASSRHRLAMLRLSVSQTSGLIADDRELKRDSYSYTIDTLNELTQEFPDKKLMLFIGIDAFSDFKSWHQWERILNLADIVVIARPQATLSDDAQKLLQERQASSVTAMPLAAGNILVRELTQLDISSTRIREDLYANRKPDFLLPRSVQEYIHHHGLYRADTPE